jgi:hypothetical protein
LPVSRTQFARAFCSSASWFEAIQAFNSPSVACLDLGALRPDRLTADALEVFFAIASFRRG